MKRAVSWLRLSYRLGALVDLAAGLMMLFPALFAFMNRPAAFQPGLDYRYAMGMGAPLMFGWAALLLWADRSPLERRDVLPLTLLVIVGEVATQAWGIAAGFIPLPALLPSFGMQALLCACFIFSYFNSSRYVAGLGRSV